MYDRKTEKAKKYNREYQRKWRIANPEKAHAIDKRHREKAGPGRHRNYTIHRRNYIGKLREEMFEHYGQVCACCGEDEKRFLTIDHINGGGGAHRRMAPGGNVVVDLRRKGWPKEGLRVLCMNCNWATRTRLPCPHELDRCGP